MEDRTLPSQFMVTTTIDNGDDTHPTPGSLRAAIIAADADIDTNGTTIVFNLPADDPNHLYYKNDGVAGQVSRSQVANTTTDDSQLTDADPDHPWSWWSIQPRGSGLPRITHPVVLDGYTQPGAHANTRIDGDDAVPRIELDGSLAGQAEGLAIDAGESTIRGLVINRFFFHGIVLDTSGGNRIQGDYIGTDPSGTLPQGNGYHGVWIFAGQNNWIGTDGYGVDDLAERNVISANGLDGIMVSDSFNVVAGNFIGTDATGTHPLGNLKDGIVVSDGNGVHPPASVRIGTNGDGVADDAERNVISGNGQAGVFITEFTAGNNVVAGNYIGTDVTGKVAVPNLHGVVTQGGTRVGVSGADVDHAAEGNVISGNSGYGINLSGGGIMIAGNSIGVDVTGETALGNGDGIGSNGSSGLIGGTTPEARNVISGNLNTGIHVFHSPNLYVLGNFIGTDATGTTPLGNQTGVFGDTCIVGGRDPNSGNVISGNGIGLRFSDGHVFGNDIGTDVTGKKALANELGLYIEGPDDTIGGTDPGAGNLISGNTYGVVIINTATRNLLQGNRIGTDASGTSALPNIRGVLLADGASGNTIGGTVAGAGNTIAFNQEYGVCVGHSNGALPFGTGNRIVGNSIFSNGGVGIDLSQGGGGDGDGVTLNDSHAGQPGPNNWQNFPVLSAAYAGASTVVMGTLHTTPSSTFTIDFYANHTPDTTGYGQGQIYLGSYTTMATDSSGNVSFNATLPVTTSPGEWISATATDPGGNTSEFSRDLKTPPLVTLAVASPINEGGTFTDAGSFSDLDSSAPWTATVNYGAGSGVQPLTLNSAKSFALSHAYTDTGSYTVTVAVTDKDGAVGTASLTETVNNVPPAVGPITAPVSPTMVNTAITAGATFTDPGIHDTHTAVRSWGDGTTSAGTVTETSGSGSVAGAHTYATDGVYTLTLTVTDKDGGVGQSVYQYVVIYDPSAGFVTGGGWITSPPGAYAANPSLTGKATFGFVSKYQKGATVPSGDTQFQFQAVGFNFHSTSYDWLVVAGAKAQYKGSGTVNGAGNDGFLLTAIDGDLPGGGGVDKFRIKVWDKTTGTILYDNQMGTSDTSDPSTAIGGGAIVIHSGTGSSGGSGGGSGTMALRVGIAEVGGPRLSLAPQLSVASQPSPAAAAGAGDAPTVVPQEVIPGQPGPGGLDLALADWVSGQGDESLVEALARDQVRARRWSQL
jgi:hypothetical protein